MPDPNLKLYQQSPAEFRQSVWRWITDPRSKGTVGDCFSKWRQRKTKDIAHKLYQNRRLLGKAGDTQSDWKTAEKIVRSPWRITLFALNRPLIKAEKHLFEPFSHHLKNSAVFDIIDRLSPSLEAIGVLLIPFVLYIAAQVYQQQQESKELERLQQEAVQNYIAQLSEILLNVEGDLRADHNQRIRMVVTAATITFFQNSNLNGDRKGQVITFLSQMGLIQGLLYSEDGVNAELVGSIISLESSNLAGASLVFVSLAGANLGYANLQGADLVVANLQEANLHGANLSGADLVGANLSGADLALTDLTGADLRNASLSGANLEVASLKRAKNLTEEQLSQVKLCDTTLPDHITLDPDRDCEDYRKPDKG